MIQNVKVTVFRGCDIAVTDKINIHVIHRGPFTTTTTSSIVITVNHYTFPLYFHYLLHTLTVYRYPHVCQIMSCVYLINWVLVTWQMGGLIIQPHFAWKQMTFVVRLRVYVGGINYPPVCQVYDTQWIVCFRRQSKMFLS